MKMHFENLSAICVKRLTTLVNFMASLPKSADKHFDMRDFFEHISDDHVPPGAKVGAPVSVRALTSCGTSACALGWAATCPSLQRQGLKMVYRRVKKSSEFDNAFVDIRFKDPDGFSQDPFDLAQEFFELDENQSHYLFGVHTHIKTPKEWAARAAYFVQTDGLGRLD